jgi:hypothetical protein
MAEQLDEGTLKALKVLQVEIKKPEEKDADKAAQANPEERKTEKFCIKLADITDVKVKNFTEKLYNVWVVAITCDEVQHFLEFETAEKRDDWGNGLRSLHHAHQWMSKRSESKADNKKLHLIKAINLQLPREGCLLSMEIETAVGKENLDILDKKEAYSSAACKEKTHDFILHNFIVPAEGASLYRFIRSVISRILMERETNTILGEIDSFRFNKVVEGRRVTAADGTQNVSEVRGLLHDAEAKLRDLALSVSDRIGRHGPSSQLLVDILLRSIEKTKIYNRMAFAVNYGSTGEDMEF